jgi:hypothetical protein
MTEVIAALDRVFGGFTPEHGVSDDALDAVEKRLGATLPPSLRALYRHTGRHPFHSACNYLVPPGELAFDHDHLTVYLENQNVCVWAIARDRLGEDDPPVAVSCVDRGTTVFLPEFDTVSALLAFQAAFQAAEILPFAGITFDRESGASRQVVFEELGPLLGDRLATTPTGEVRTRIREIEAHAALTARAWAFLAPRDR